MIWVLFLAIVLFRGYLYRDERRRLGQPIARKRLRASVTIMLIIYLGCLSLLMGLENKLIYHPWSAADYWTPPTGLKYEDVTLKSKTGDTIHAWWCPDPQSNITILFSHGNAGNLSGHAHIIGAIRARVPCNVLIYDYPGFGKSNGRPNESGCYGAAEAAYEWVIRVKQVPADKILLMGQSLGCAMACHLAAKVDHRGLVLLSPFTTIRDIGQEVLPIFPVKWIMRHRYDNRSKLKEYQKPLLIGHSTSDEVIPFHHGKALYESAATKQKTFCKISGFGHNEFAPNFFVAMKVFVDGLK
jgi:esterase/lipase